MTEIFRTKQGSAVTVDGGQARIAFDWLGEDACFDCVPYYEHWDDCLRWECNECGGGSAELENAGEGKA